MDIAIVDDMQDEIEAAKGMLKEYSTLNNIDMNIVSFSSAEAFLKKFRPFLYTVIFMDIYMDGMTGIEAAEQIRKLDSSVIIIFLTTSEEHLHEAFRCHAYEYLIKPVVREKIFRTMDDILKITTDSGSKRLNFTGQRREYSLKYSDILYIQTEATGSNYLEISDSAGNIYRTRMTFTSLCSEISEDSCFLVIQSGVLVNMEHIAFLENKCCTLDCGKSFPVAVKKEKELRQRWQNFMFDIIRKQSMR